MLAPQSGTYQHDAIDHHDKDWEPGDERESAILPRQAIIRTSRGLQGRTQHHHAAAIR
jgi:hypothetical protein